MKRDNRVVLGVMFAIIVAVTVILGSIGNIEKTEEFSKEYIMAEELPLLLSFTYYEKEQWEEILKDMVKGKLSYGELEKLLDYMGVAEHITYEKKTRFQKITRADFFDVYDQMIDILDVENRVALQERVFIKKNSQENVWLTQYGYEKLELALQNLQPYDIYQAYILNNTIVGLREKSDAPVRWENVFVHYIKEKEGEVLFEKERIPLEFPEEIEQITDTICDIEWKDGRISAIYKKEDMISGTVLSYNEKQIEIAGYGALEHSGNLKVYKTYGTVEQLDESKLVIGNLLADFVVAKGEVCGIILKEPAQMEWIRVLLLNGEELYYPDILVKADVESKVSFTEQEQVVSAHTSIRASDYWNEDTQGYLTIEPTGEGGYLYLVDEKGKEISLGYEGSFEIRKYEQGYCIVNEVPLEKYLCAVVPSEMPASYELEALRAQAICARSYACIQLTNNKYAGFAANVDDSTNYQVYNKQPRNEKTTCAVQDTVGEVLQYNGEIAEAYYYSTSCGFSQYMDVWNLTEEEKYGYLQSVSLLAEDKNGTDDNETMDNISSGNKESIAVDITGEEAFGAFIQNKEYKAYDSDAAYFRWSAELDLINRKDAVCQAITARASANSSNVQILDNKGNPTNQKPEELGKIEKLILEERSQGGVLKKLRIQFEKGSVLLITEYNIRKVLGEAVTVMTDKDDKEITVLNLLPSAAFTAIPVEEGYVLYGGGYGHGIGLSQNGANGMAKAGFTYVDILQKFYQNIQIKNIYNSSDVQ